MDHPKRPKASYPAVLWGHSWHVYLELAPARVWLVPTPPSHQFCAGIVEWGDGWVVWPPTKDFGVHATAVLPTLPQYATQEEAGAACIVEWA